MIAKPRSIKQNYILNIIRLTLNVSVIIATMPFVNRILGSSGIGKVEYGYSVLETFLIFSALGIPIYGVRQIGRYRDDVTERSRITIELLILMALTTAFAYCCFFILLAVNNYEPSMREVLIVISFTLFLNNFSLEWFYQGIENQMYITIRHVFIKIVSLVILYFTVNTASDTTNYAIFMVVTVYGGTLFNLFHIKNYIIIDKTTLSGLNIKRHLKPSITILMASAASSIYIQLDKLMLGSMVSKSAVGCYSQAVKLTRQMMLIITTLGTIMLPRLASLHHNNLKAEYYTFLKRSLNYIYFIVVPLSILFFMLAKPIILLMAGENFLPSIPVLKISAPIIVIASLSYFIGFIVLYSLGKEKIYTYALWAAAFINFTFNLYAIPAYKETGAAISTLLAEVASLAILVVVSRKIIFKAGFFSSDKLIYITAGVAMAIIIYAVSFLKLPLLLQITFSSLSAMTVYAGVLYFLGDKVTHEIYSIIMRTFSRK